MMTDDEKLVELEVALSRLVYHDRAAASRAGLQGCMELQDAEQTLIDTCGYKKGKTGLLLHDLIRIRQS
jgi:hypothetical protein